MEAHCSEGHADSSKAVMHVRGRGIALVGRLRGVFFQAKVLHHRAKPNPAWLIPRLHLQRSHHSQVVWEELHFKNEVQMLLSKSIFYCIQMETSGTSACFSLLEP